MTPIINGVGQSIATADKLNGLACFLRQHMAITKAVWNKHPKIPKRYHYIDAYAGYGYNDECDTPGSPLVFLDIAAEENIPFDARFVEKNQDSAVTLQGSVKKRCYYDPILSKSTALVINYDNRDFIPFYISVAMMGCPVGMLLVDPNGIPDIQLLSWISRLNNSSRLDFLIRYNSSAVKRNRLGKTGRAEDHLKAINKKFWMIRAPMKGDPWQWVFLIGSNAELNPWKSKGFHSLKSEEGQRIFELISLTDKELERRHQPCLTTE